MAATVSGMFGIIPATRSPTPTPSALRACCSRDTSAESCANDQPILALILATKHQGVAVVGPAQQVLSEIDLGVREEGGPRHGVEIDGAPAAFFADYPTEIPKLIPEQIRVLDAPSVEIAVSLQATLVPAIGFP